MKSFAPTPAAAPRTGLPGAMCRCSGRIPAGRLNCRWPRPATSKPRPISSTKMTGSTGPPVRTWAFASIPILPAPPTSFTAPSPACLGPPKTGPPPPTPRWTPSSNHSKPKATPPCRPPAPSATSPGSCRTLSPGSAAASSICCRCIPRRSPTRALAASAARTPPWISPPWTRPWWSSTNARPALTSFAN